MYDSGLKLSMDGALSIAGASSTASSSAGTSSCGPASAYLTLFGSPVQSSRPICASPRRHHKGRAFSRCRFAYRCTSLISIFALLVSTGMPSVAETASDAVAELLAVAECVFDTHVEMTYKPDTPQEQREAQ
ncbi:hypothetical protein NM688_g4729 [Phlebia brevispora]|uniref:Uncharacterized protein n=1 Tax=Phlebia brevispora TaxID=194682 RepID=A0ACC1T1U4_9APHY|nr:hypothetical protein NM688_g4729 [Phlebia brevispora]